MVSKFGEKGLIKIILVHFSSRATVLEFAKFLVFSTHKIIGLGPPLQVPAGLPSTQGASSFDGNGPIKILLDFCLQNCGGGI